MDKEIIDVIDTTVKIGLGALIASISGYFLNQQKFNLEIAKAEKAEIRFTIKEMVSCIAKSETFVNRYSLSIDQNGEKELGFLVEAELEAYQALGLAHLINNPEISEKVDEYVQYVEKIYIEGIKGDYVAFNKLINKWSYHRNSIYKLLLN